MFCENCGNPMPEDSKFCMSCGAKVAAAGPEGQAVQETAAATETVQAVEAPAADNVFVTEQQEAPAEPVQYEPQPQPAAPAPQPRPVQPAPQPEPVRYAQPQPAPQTQTYQQPAPQPQSYQQPAAPVSQPATVKTERPLPVWKYMGIMLLTGIPVIGLIMILVWSFGKSWNKNTRNFARAVLIFGIIGFILSIVGAIMYIDVLKDLMDFFNSNFEISLPG